MKHHNWNKIREAITSCIFCLSSEHKSLDCPHLEERLDRKENKIAKDKNRDRTESEHN